MKVKAAVAHKAGAPLTIETVDLEGPKAGEVLVEIKATGICHTDEFTLSGADPEGLFPVDPRARRRGRRRRRRARRDDAAGKAITSSRSTCPSAAQCEYCVSGKTNLCQAIRVTQGQGVMPDGTSRFSLGRQEAAALHGHVDVLELHRGAGDRAREDPRGRALRQGVLHRLRRDDRHRRRHQHREGRAGRERRGVRPGRHRAERDPGRAARRREHDRRRRPEPGAARARREVRHDALREPEGSRRRSRAVPRQPHRRAAPTTASSASATWT